jgi:hypothetical protein
MGIPLLRIGRLLIVEKQFKLRSKEKDIGHE